MASVGGDIVLHGGQGDALAKLLDDCDGNAPEAFRAYAEVLREAAAEAGRVADVLRMFDPAAYRVEADGNMVYLHGAGPGADELVEALHEEGLLVYLGDLTEECLCEECMAARGFEPEDGEGEEYEPGYEAEEGYGEEEEG